MISHNSFCSPTSVKVTHAPGGYSSLSLAWSSNEVSKKNNNLVSIPELAKRQEVMAQKQSLQFHPLSPVSLSLSESNRLLEEQLNYYQQKNKLLRESIFGPSDNLERIQPKFDRSRLLPSTHLYNDYQGYKRQEMPQIQELQKALEDREKYRVQHRQEIAQKRNDQTFQMRSPQRLSVKISSPPGGRSSIFFG